MRYLVLVAPYSAAIFIYLLSPLLSGQVKASVTAAISLGHRHGAPFSEATVPYYISEPVIGDYVEYAMDAVQIWPAVLLPIVGAVYGFTAGVPSPVALTFLVGACLVGAATVAWIQSKSPSDYVSRKWRGYSVVTCIGICLNVIGIVLAVVLG